jgi:hypothetical protein
MRPFKIIMFLLLLLTFTTQTIRHIYIKRVEPKDSILDKYKEKTEKNIDESKNLDELIKLYDDSNNKVKEYEKNPKNEKIEYYKQISTEPYKTKTKIENAIKTIENQKKSIIEFIFYWLCGFICLGIGLFILIIKNKWIGLGFILIGFIEMAVWTSPLFRSYGPQYAFNLLLNLKLIFSILSFMLLLILWVLNEYLFDKK